MTDVEAQWRALEGFGRRIQDRELLRSFFRAVFAAAAADGVVIKGGPQIEDLVRMTLELVQRQSEGRGDA